MMGSCSCLTDVFLASCQCALLSRHTNARYSTSGETPPAVASTVGRLPQLCVTLKGEDHEAGSVFNQRHQEVPRLGLRRLKLVGLVVLLMQSKYLEVDVALVKEVRVAFAPNRSLARPSVA